MWSRLSIPADREPGRKTKSSPLVNESPSLCDKNSSSGMPWLSSATVAIPLEVKFSKVGFASTVACDNRDSPSTDQPAFVEIEIE